MDVWPEGPRLYRLQATLSTRLAHDIGEAAQKSSLNGKERGGTGVLMEGRGSEEGVDTLIKSWYVLIDFGNDDHTWRGMSASGALRAGASTAETGLGANETSVSKGFLASGCVSVSGWSLGPGATVGGIRSITRKREVTPGEFQGHRTWRSITGGYLPHAYPFRLPANASTRGIHRAGSAS
jgi:hypothetical protein